MSPIALICADIRTAILGITPNEEPAWTYKRHSGREPLDTADTAGREHVRIFEVFPDVDARPGFMNGSLLHMAQTAVIQVRYAVPETRGGHERARVLAGSDQAQILHTLMRANTWATGVDFVQAEVRQQGRFTHLGGGVYLLSFEVEISYNHAA